MAKKKKTMEEALVPEEEQKSIISMNWEWVRLGSVIELISGRDISSKHCNIEGIGIPYIMGASNIDENELNIERWIEEPTVIGKKGDILVSVKGTIGKTVVLNIEAAHLSRQIMAMRNKNIVDRNYLYYFIRIYVNQLKESAKGIIPGISRSDILNAPFPLPPLNEQKRIADKVERLLNKIDEAKQLIEEVKESFELRRAAILDKAFRGGIDSSNNNLNSYLAQAKMQNPFEIPENWEWINLGEVASFINGDRGKNYPNKDEFLNEGIPFINTGHLKDGKVDFSKMLYISEEKYQTLNSGKVKEGDILYCLRGNTLGKTGIVSNIKIGAIASSLVIIRPNYNNLNSKLLYYYLISPLGRVMIDIFDNGSAQPNLSVKSVKEFRVPYPPLSEQEQIVRNIDKLLGKTTKANKELSKLEYRLEGLKKSVLSKAFKGELGTNDPTEENAIELLKEVLKEKQ